MLQLHGLAYRPFGLRTNLRHHDLHHTLSYALPLGFLQTTFFPSFQLVQFGGQGLLSITTWSVHHKYTARQLGHETSVIA